MTTVLDLTDAVDAAYRGSKSMVKCPAHDDNQASLSVGPGADQPVVLHCHAGCDTDAIITASGLSYNDISNRREEPDIWTPAGNASQVYEYRLANGHVEFQTLRVPLLGGGKTFRQRHWSNDHWAWNLENCERVIYRLPEVLACVEAGSVIWIAEGEKDVEALVAQGVCATTNPMGAGKWLPEYSALLAGATVTVVADADAPGRAHARAVRESLLESGCQVRLVEPRAGAKDATDHFVAGGTLFDFVETTPEQMIQRPTFGMDVLDLILRRTDAVKFVIPGVLATSERLLLTGFEGHGKSTWCRQAAVMTASGMNPFTGHNMEPRKVLFIDGENHPDQTTMDWRNLVGLAARHDHPIERDMLVILEEWDNDDLDLTRPEGRAWLHERIHAYRPDLVVLGPLTNMAGRDLKDDEPVRRLRNAINSARSICGSAFIMEHHAPHKGPMDKERPVRPYGSSMFLKWPDFGYGLKPTDDPNVYQWARTRFPRVRSRGWPEYLRLGTPNTLEWPWMEGDPL